MKRRLDETADAKREASVGGATSAALSDDMKLMVAELVAKELLQGLVPAAGGATSRFGNVSWEPTEEQNVNAFLHQKLGKNHLTRRPGPGGTRLTYIESCKAIELANLAFGFNGWSCRVLECKEEYRIQKGDRWHLGYSSHMRIELKDGSSHEDFGFGQSDGQRDLGAAIEQAKKASISDARKRALRLFGEYLGNSCYDREHIKEVHSNRAPASVNAASPAEMAGRSPGGATAVSASGAPTVLTAAAAAPQASASNGQQQQQQSAVPSAMQPPRAQPGHQGQAQTPPRQTFNVPNSAMPPRHTNGPPTSSPYAQTNQSTSATAAPASSISSVASRISALQAAEMNKRQAVANASGTPTPAQSAQLHQQQQQQQQRAYQPNQQSSPAMQNQPPPAMANTHSALQQRQQHPVQHQHQQQQQRTYQPSPAMQTHPPPAAASAQSPFGQQQYPLRQPLHTLGMNAPPPTRMGAYSSQQGPPSIKTEAHAGPVGSGAPAAAASGTSSAYDINDLSLSQFDYDPQR